MYLIHAKHLLIILNYFSQSKNHFSMVPPPLIGDYSAGYGYWGDINIKIITASNRVDN